MQDRDNVMPAVRHSLSQTNYRPRQTTSTWQTLPVHALTDLYLVTKA